jgi:hypothetical protein
MKLITILFVFLTACGSSVTNNKSVVEENTNESLDQIGDIPFIVLYQDSNSSFEDIGFEVFEDSKDFEDGLTMVNRNRQPGLMAPEIDFSKFRVALLHIGNRSSGGYAINVERVEKTDTNIIVYYKNQFPQPEKPVTMAFTSPWTMVRFENHNLPVVFAPINN